MISSETISGELLKQTIERVWESLPPVWTQIRDNVRKTATDNYDITIEQFHVLRLIKRGVCSVSELAATKKISRPAISQSVDGLVEKGLIVRRPSQEDRRFIGLELTPAGLEMINAIFARNQEWMCQKMAGLSPDELNCIQAGMRALRKSFLD